MPHAPLYEPLRLGSVDNFKAFVQTLGVDNVATLDFPFVQELPKREKSKLANLWEALKEANAATREHGALVPTGFAAELLGVSRTRVDQLLEAGKLTAVVVHKTRFVSENSLVAWAKAEHITGRPPSLKSCIAASRSKNS